MSKIQIYSIINGQRIIAKLQITWSGFPIIIISLSIKVIINCKIVLKTKYIAQQNPRRGRLSGKGMG
jgi:hypothetical protein